MTQLSLAHLEYYGKKRITRKEKILADLEKLIPWSELLSALIPYYHVSGKPGRQPKPLLMMLRFYIVQLVFGYSDEACEDALYDILPLRSFVGIDLSQEEVPDATTLENFRHLLEKHNLAPQVLKAINHTLQSRGLMLSRGTIVDATIIHAPTSTKNKEGKRDEEMHSTKKGNNYHFGAKVHIGVDKDSGAVHSVEVTAANVADVTMTKKLLHGQEQELYGDAGYTGVEKRAEMAEVKLRWQIAMKRTKLSKMIAVAGMGYKYYERLKASVRSKVEHVFGQMKCRFKYRKLRYKGIAKNKNQIVMLLAIGNMFLMKNKMQAQENCA